jgi:hypothetical protein
MQHLQEAISRVKCDHSIPPFILRVLNIVTVCVYINGNVNLDGSYTFSK